MTSVRISLAAVLILCAADTVDPFPACPAQLRCRARFPDSCMLVGHHGPAVEQLLGLSSLSGLPDQWWLHRRSVSRYDLLLREARRVNGQRIRR
jgi:hypothetical protein